VDSLHQQAGSRNVIELHGNIWRTICFDERTPVESWPDTEEVPPRCPRCGGLLRPDVVWFGESLPQQALHAAFFASQQCDLFLAIGTSGVVQPAASLPLVALEQGITTVEINPNPTPFTPKASFVLAGTSAQLLPVLVQALVG
jgi:NAD-dependent deacetylase